MERFHKEIVSPRGVHSVNEVKPVSKTMKSNFLENKSNSTFESNSALSSIDKCSFFEYKSNSIDMSKFLEDQRTCFADNPDEPKYYTYYLIVSELIAKATDRDKLLEE